MGIGHQSRQGALQPVGFRNEVSIEDSDEIARDLGEGVCQCASFVAAAIMPVQVLDIQAVQSVQPRNQGRQDGHCAVCRIIQNLNLEFVLGVIQCSDSFHHPSRHCWLVVDGDLHCDRGPLDDLGIIGRPVVPTTVEPEQNQGDKDEYAV